MATLKVKDVMEVCNCSQRTVLNWIKKGYLHAILVPNKRGRGAFAIEEADLKAFMESGYYAGNSENINKRRLFKGVPSVEKCYPINILASVSQIDFDQEEASKDIWDFDIRQFLNLIGLLNDQEQRVIQMRYQYGMTLAEVAATFDLTRERIRQIQAKAERKLRGLMRGKGCRVVMREEYNELQNKYASLVADYEKLRMQYNKIAGDKAVKAADISQINLENMDLTVRSYNCLKRAEINTLQDIIEFDMNQQDPPSRHNWLAIWNFGRKSLMEVAEKVFTYCGYRIQYFHDGEYQGLIPVFEGEHLAAGNTKCFRGEAQDVSMPAT